MPLSAEGLSVAIGPRACAITGGKIARIVTLAGGASLRRYHRVLFETGTPATLVVMELGDDRRPEEASKDVAPTELPFVDVLRYLERGGVAVPRLYHHDEPAGLLYLEDLGDDTFESRVQGQDAATQRRYYRLAIDDLVTMQRYAADHAGGCIAFGRGFDRDLLRWELEHFVEWGLADVQLSDGERAEVARSFDDIATRLAAEPRGFVHRDYQSRNLMVQDRGDGEVRLRLIDFQDALLGTRAYDLVALLRDSYVVLSPSLVDELVGYHAERAAIDPPTLRALFALQTVQRKLKDAGRFVFIDRVKKNPGFLPYIPSSQAYAAAALSHLPEYAGLREVLARHLPAFAGT
jgi:N-acetylmuramate 1-kinase